MNEENKKVLSKKNRLIIIFLSLIMLLAGLFLLVRNILKQKNADPSNDTSAQENTTIPEMNNAAEYGSVGFEVLDNDPLKYITELKNFTATAVVSSTYNSIKDSVTYSVTSYNGKFRIENESKTVIYDGRKLSVKTPVYTTQTEEEKYSLYTELGSISLSDLKNKMNGAENDCTTELNGNDLLVSFTENGVVREQFTLSADNGIIVSAQYFSDGQKTGECILKNITLLNENDLKPDIFHID